jgi:hypothetical protein
MKTRYPVALALLLCCFTSAAFSQDKLGQLRSWDGKYTQETDDKGKVKADFFALPEVRTPLKSLLKPVDFNLVTKGYSVGSPLKLFGDFLATTMCRPHNCGDERAGLVINVNTGDVYVRMARGTKVRWIMSPGRKEADLPKEVQDLVGDPK